MTPLLYWITELLTPFIPDFEWYFMYGTKFQFAIVAFIILAYIYKSSTKLRDGLALISIHIIYALTMDTIFSGVDSLWYLIETSIFASLAIWIAFRLEMVTRTINRNNVLLAFYKGNGGSFKMMLANLLGFPVKSVCVIAGDKVLRIKNKEFVLKDSASCIINSDDYVVIDTCKPANDCFLEAMKVYEGTEAKNKLLKTDCISKIEPLLVMIGYAPRNIFEKIPSVYLQRCLSHV